MAGRTGNDLSVPAGWADVEAGALLAPGERVELPLALAPGMYTLVAGAGADALGLARSDSRWPDIRTLVAGGGIVRLGQGSAERAQSHAATSFHPARTGGCTAGAVERFFDAHPASVPGPTGWAGAGSRHGSRCGRRHGIVHWLHQLDQILCSAMQTTWPFGTSEVGSTGSRSACRRAVACGSRRSAMAYWRCSHARRAVRAVASSCTVHCEDYRASHNCGWASPAGPS